MTGCAVDVLPSTKTAMNEFMGPFGDVGITRRRDAGLEVVDLTQAMFAQADLTLDYTDLPRVCRVVSNTY